MYFTLTWESKGFSGYYDVPSFVLLALTPPSVLLLSHSFQDFIVGIRALLGSMFKRQDRMQMEVIEVLTHSSALVRSEGMGALVKIKDRVSYDLMRDGISLIINNFTVDEIRHNITAKINARQTRLELASNLFENLAKVSPGIGMLGTLLGLIDMMANLKDPSAIGGGMAIAMITTFYGLILGTFMYGPAGERVSHFADKTLEIDTLVLEGVLSLKGKKSSMHFKDIVKTYANQKQTAPDPRRKGA